ncbi:hypothetical protein ACR77J_08020 [Tissierella praeacuta]|uniref:hypothetical protein n=1 Tax=Tissierella praeacuta TaxID=43131 RepID=UPI003DA655B2
MDKIDKYVYEQIQDRKETKEPYENLFNKIYGIELSNTEARKELRGIENHLEYKKEHEDELLEQDGNMPRYNETTEILENGNYKSDKLLKMSAEQSKDVDYLLKAHGFDSGFWQVTSARNNIWNVYSKQDGIQQLYSSKITVKPIIPEFKEEWIKDTIKNINFSNINIKTNHRFINTGKTVEINFCDVHIGKFINELVSNGLYDTDLAIQRYSDAIDDAIAKISIFDIRKIIFIVGQDYMNVDNLSGTTTKGTRQDMNDFYETIYKKAYSCLIETVEKLRKVAPVDVIYVKGNHDKQTTFSMVCGLEEMYKAMNIKDVNVDSGLKQRKYVTFGDVLIGYGHGEEERNRIFDCMQDDQRHNWHKTRKYFHLSHKHRESKQEKAGVIYQWLGALSENCNWTWSCGFVGSEKKGHVFVYDDEYGLEAEFFIKA